METGLVLLFGNESSIKDNMETGLVLFGSITNNLETGLILLFANESSKKDNLETGLVMRVT